MAATASSAILRIWYEPIDEALFVTFVGGKTYAYEGVPGQLCRSFLAAESRGRFFNVNIRDHYPHRLVKSRRTS
jgi:KTSC domain-containing protein